jgi:hypothetical protein
MESSDLSIRLDSEPTAPVSATPAVQGQSASGEEKSKPRRRPPPPEPAAEPEQEDGDRPQHRIDSLA